MIGIVECGFLFKVVFMDLIFLFKVLIFGIVEGLIEFLFVFLIGYLIIVGSLFDYIDE